MSQQVTSHGRWLTLALGAILVASAGLVWKALSRPSTNNVRDTRLESGQHLGFVLVAPTGQVGGELAAAVDSARRALRKVAAQSGSHYTTIGIADNWNVAHGIAQLTELGPFDELIVGRNWLNTGVERYITELNGLAAVPQAIVVRRMVTTDTIPFRYGPMQVLARVVGRRDIQAWAAAGAPVRLVTTVGERPVAR